MLKLPVGGIRVQVTLITIVACFVAMAAIVSLTSVAALQSVRSILSQSMSERLDVAEAEVEQGNIADAVDHSGISLMQAVDADGNVIVSTPNAAGLVAISADEEVYEVDDLELDEFPEDPPDDEAGSTSAGGAAPNAHLVEASKILATPGPFLVMCRTVDSPDGPVTLVALTSVHLAFDIADATARVVAGLLLVVLVFAGVFAWFMTGRTLRPVEQMRRDAEHISVRDLSGRITPPENDKDLSALADTFNGLLSRVEASVDEQKRFVSDASHELKSPIAATSVMLEALRNHPESLRDDEVLADLTSENSRLSSIVEDLLMLARQDEGRLVVERVPTDYYDVLYEEVASLRQRAEVPVDDASVQPIIGLVDPALLSHAVRNLLDNAARYAASRVKVSCSERDGRAIIAISDDGPGIPAKEREHVFGRFVRLEEDRSRKQGSTGLGLSVVRGNIERMGGRVYFGEPEIGGATAIIELPLE